MFLYSFFFNCYNKKINFFITKFIVKSMMAVGPPFPHPSSLVLDPGLNLIVKEGFWLSCTSATWTICSSRGRRSDSPQLPVLSRYLFKTQTRVFSASASRAGRRRVSVWYIHLMHTRCLGVFKKQSFPLARQKRKTV